jgi:signal transduction histidine kinase
MGAPSFKQLGDLSDEELKARYDSETQHTAAGLGFYLDELRRRETAAQNARIEEMTRTMVTYTMVIVVLTTVVTIATIVNVVVLFVR